MKKMEWKIVSSDLERQLKKAKKEIENFMNWDFDNFCGNCDFCEICEYFVDEECTGTEGEDCRKAITKYLAQ